MSISDSISIEKLDSKNISDSDYRKLQELTEDILGYG